MPTFKPMVYHGDKRIVMLKIAPKITGNLDSRHKIFDKREENYHYIVVTSLPTLQARHGPSELRNHRMRNGWSRNEASAKYHDQDINWHLDLAEKFSIITIDEAHAIKNEATASHSTVRWLKPQFTILAKASVLPNRVTDFQGYMNFIQADPSLWTKLEALGVNDKVNPYTLPDGHQAAVLQMTYRAMERFIINATDSTLAGLYLRKVWRKCMIRRTYASPNPRFPTQVVGQAIASLYSRRIPCEFSANELTLYKTYSERPLRKLMTVLPDGTLVWNRKYSRQLILNSSWLGFHYIEDDVHGHTMKRWKDETKPYLLYRWIRLLHYHMKKCNAPDQWELPARDDIPSLLAIACRGSPKLRATLRIIAELVILHKKKWIIWCSLPANQLLLYACFQALNIWSACYTSELSREQRGDLVKAFTEDMNCRVFIGSWNIYWINWAEFTITMQSHLRMGFAA